MGRITQKFSVVPSVESHLQSVEELYGSKLVALDGDVGYLKDFYFDDNIWVVRYAVADTGSWLADRMVLLSPHGFGKLDRNHKTLHVNLRKMQIQDCPSIESHGVVSRQYEADYYRHYGWPAYWAGDAMWGVSSSPISDPTARDKSEEPRMYYHRDDKHLESAREVIGYPVQAADGEIGHVKDFLVDDRSWAIRDLVVETGSSISGSRIRLSTDKVNWISYNDSKVHVSVTKADLEKAGKRLFVAIAEPERDGVRPHG